MNKAAKIKPVYRSMLADLETPLSAYLKVGGHPSFLLESVEQGERIARYSFIGTGARRRIEARGEKVTVTTPDGIETFDSKDPLRILWDMTVAETDTSEELSGLTDSTVGGLVSIIKVFT